LTLDSNGKVLHKPSFDSFCELSEVIGNKSKKISMDSFQLIKTAKEQTLTSYQTKANTIGGGQELDFYLGEIKQYTTSTCDSLQEVMNSPIREELTKLAISNWEKANKVMEFTSNQQAMSNLVPHTHSYDNLFVVISNKCMELSGPAQQQILCFINQLHELSLNEMNLTNLMYGETYLFISGSIFTMFAISIVGLISTGEIDMIWHNHKMIGDLKNLKSKLLTKCKARVSPLLDRPLTMWNHRVTLFGVSWSPTTVNTVKIMGFFTCGYFAAYNNISLFSLIPIAIGHATASSRTTSPEERAGREIAKAITKATDFSKPIFDAGINFLTQIPIVGGSLLKFKIWTTMLKEVAINS
jgi:hypothetical protein